MDKNMFENTVLALLTITPGLGNIQTRKALCIADAVHYSLHGDSITGSRYIKEKFGPVLDKEGYRCLIEMMFAEKIRNDEIYAGYGTENHYYAQTEPDWKMFNDSQLNIIKYAAHIAMNHRASELSNLTHDDIYKNIPMYAEIPLSEICKPVVTDYDTEPFTQEEREDARYFFEHDAANIFA